MMTSAPIKIKKYVEGVDYYIDPLDGRLVWTGEYLFKRGYCCNHGCRHCPYKETSIHKHIDIVYEK